jgi:hypothetical protein
MYLTAQHVTHAPSGPAGYNAYYYVHGYVWDGAPPPQFRQDPGTLMNQLVPVDPGGNRVRSYLDIICPDDTSWHEIRQSFVTFVSEFQLRPLPWEGVIGRCLFRVGMDFGIARQWQPEIANLYRTVQSVRI